MISITYRKKLTSKSFKILKELNLSMKQDILI